MHTNTKRLIALTAIISIIATLLIVFLSLKNNWVLQLVTGNYHTQASEQNINQKTLFTCGMHPWIISEEPGNCPICGMKLTPKRNNNSMDKSSNSVHGVNVSIDPVVRQNMGIRRFEKNLTPTIFRKFIDMPGRLIYDGEKFIIKIRKRAHTPVLKTI